MSSRSPYNLLSTVGLVVLTVAAAGLSVAALTQERGVQSAEAQPNPPVLATLTASPSPLKSATQSEFSPSPKSTVGDINAPESGRTVVIIGDGYSAHDAPNAWMESVSAELGWSSVTNLSAQGRGYIQEPSFCNVSQCANFEGTIPAVVEQDPDVVVTFGGTADGDQDLSDAAGAYFTALRAALPETELIAVSPITSEDEEPYFLRLHDQTIRAGVEAAGGTFIDVGRPGVGDGEDLSASSQQEVARTIIAELS